MIRLLMWLCLWCLCLGMLEIDAKYKDGLRIRLRNIWKRKAKKR